MDMESKQRLASNPLWPHPQATNVNFGDPTLNPKACTASTQYHTCICFLVRAPSMPMQSSFRVPFVDSVVLYGVITHLQNSKTGCLLLPGAFALGKPMSSSFAAFWRIQPYIDGHLGNATTAEAFFRQTVAWFGPASKSPDVASTVSKTCELPSCRSFLRYMTHDSLASFSWRRLSDKSDAP